MRYGCGPRKKMSKYESYFTKDIAIRRLAQNSNGQEVQSSKKDISWGCEKRNSHIESSA